MGCFLHLFILPSWGRLDFVFPSIPVGFPYIISYFPIGRGLEVFTNDVIVSSTVNVEISMQYIFPRILRRALHAEKYNVSKSNNHNRTNGINWCVRKHLITQTELDARKLSSAKMYRFTVLINDTTHMATSDQCMCYLRLAYY